jgi:uncharacterized membrane protein YphA (DoxX/SURF4 family)
MMTSGMPKIARLILRGVVSALFLFAAYSKFRYPHSFGHWGYSDPFAIFVAIAEVCGAIALWIPTVSRVAAVGLAIIMIGAAFSYMRAGEPRQGVVPVIVLFALTRLAMR